METTNQSSIPKASNGTIMIVANTFWITFNFRLELIKSLLINNYKVYCVGDIEDEFIKSKSRLYNVGAEVIQVKQDRKGINPLYDIIYFSKLIKIYHNLKPIVVFHFTPKPNIYGSLSCRILGIKSISTINGLGSGLLKRNLISIIQLFLYRLALRNNKIVCFQNKYDIDYFIKKRIISSFQARLVPGSGIDTEFFKLPALEIKRPLKFIFVARLIKDKGFMEFIEAARKVMSTREDAKFFVAGFLDIGNPSAISSSSFKELVSEGLFEYLGSLPDVREAFKITHVVVVPSYREGLSRTLLEAASCSRPIISTNVPGCREIVKHGINGLLCEAKSVDSLYTVFINMLELSDQKLIAMGEAGRDIVVKFYNSDIVNQTYLGVIDEILGYNRS